MKQRPIELALPLNNMNLPVNSPMVYNLDMQPRKTLPKTALPRLYFIDREIASGKYPNAPALAKKYETSLSSINRDIAYMRDMMNAPIAYDFFKKGFYYTEKTFRLPAAYATVDDLLALGMAKNLLDLYRNTPIHEAALTLLENILAPLHGEQNAEWFLDRIIIPKTASAPVNAEIWNKIVIGLRENRVIAFHYEDAEAKRLYTREKTQKQKLDVRCVHPYQLIFDRSNWYLYAFDKDRKDFRLFSVARMNDVELKKENFEIKKDFDYRSMEGISYFGIYKGAQTNKFVIEITGDTRWIKERQWADDQQIQKTKTGIKLSFTSNQFEKVLEWTLSQGSYARPLAPKAFVELWKSIVGDMAKIARR
jgi:predicted DNA-binding transcriptional regulator YafY